MKIGRPPIHGKSRTPEHWVWWEMVRRCTWSKHKAYPLYGGRGIKVCARWMNFENFLADMGPRPSSKHSIDRYPNNDGNYELGNCRWATMLEQSRNRRTNHFVTFNNETLTILDWSRRIGIDPAALRRRLSEWPLEKAMTAPSLWRKGRVGNRWKTRANRMLTFNGETKTMKEWAERIGLKLSTLHSRISYLGMSVEKALTLPLHGRPKT